MERLVLKQLVTVTGKSFLGRDATVTLAPHPRNERGWWWNVGTDVQPNLQPLTCENITPGLHSLDFVWGSHTSTPDQAMSGVRALAKLPTYKYRVPIVEHVIALRGSGLDSVVITTPSRRLPYDGCAAIFWDAVKPHLDCAGTVRWVRLPPTQTGTDTSRFMLCSPYDQEPGLQIKIYIDYGDGIQLEKTYPWSLEIFEQAVRSITFGYPHRRRHLARLARVFGWPHYDHVMWRNLADPKGDAETIALHRLLDLMGELAAAQPAGFLFGGTIESHCAGHRHGLLLAHEVARTWYDFNRC